MLSERMLSRLIHTMTKRELTLKPTDETMMPPAKPGQKYMLYLHVPFCERLCPYCSFNRYPFRENVAKPYFANMRKEMMMLKDLGYDFESIYVGGGTPTVMIDELCETLDLARDNFDIREVASETNPNHLTQPWLDKLRGRVQRLSVGVQSFDNDLLKQMDRYEKYGSGEEILERIAEAEPYFDSLNVDMIFNFPSQTEDVLLADLEKIALCGCRQTTFSPLYVSSATARKMAATLGKVDYDREYRYYQILDGVLAGGDDPLFERTTLWTFTRQGQQEGASLCGFENSKPQIEEYQVNYDEYPAIGSGSITHLNGCLYVNNFSIKDYNAAIEAGRMSIMGKTVMSDRDLMRYRFLLDLYKLRLDKRAFERDFGCSVETGLPLEMAFMRLNKAFATDNEEELTLTPKGRYLTVVMYRQFLSGMNNLRDQARAALTGAERELLFGDGCPA
ncbi:coproporphyrinogen III oxidase family protein [Gordonibacter massiliensis (ex Traore et al. 2017)]|uniref:Heme chaperone HemW n=1 Tax=Gordonibacter massiliensis (ex Traore et al. 2017) TaxID=1841863 RepID=A0A842JCE5_9ACTN|nr:coproporphyrinogen III oxidase family protein [Gordonibacter massiliensis (ex Traore et al. 2017)]MBC2888536.1 coproporphyrinogen III oxidase family protein [Gordonibacter massiliensis (ex Traore et al. 2017)]